MQQEVATGADPSDMEPIRERIDQTKTEFIAGMEDDFNTPQALASLYELIRQVNRWSQQPGFSLTQQARSLLQQALNTLLDLGGILGLFEPALAGAATSSDQEIEDLIEQRNQAKQAKDWARADAIRQQLQEQGILLEDTVQGVRWRRE